jgi:hypothetical protein
LVHYNITKTEWRNVLFKEILLPTEPREISAIFGIITLSTLIDSQNYSIALGQE